MKSQNRINSKSQQAAAGNWGHPRPFTKKHTNVPTPPEQSRHKGVNKKKKKKKNKRDWVKEWNSCPFCKKPLLLVLNQEDATKIFCQKDTIFSLRRTAIIWGGIHAKKCGCGARRLTKACPCCKRNTWFKGGIYMHRRMGCGCGFEGRKK